MSKHVQTAEILFPSEDESRPVAKKATLEKKKIRSSATSRKHIRPVDINPAKSHELFGTDSEDEDSNSEADEAAEVVSRKEDDMKNETSKKRKFAFTSTKELEKKKTKPSTSAAAPSPAPATKKVTARDIFGSDSDDGIDENIIKNAPYSTAANSKNELMQCENCKTEMTRNEYKYHMKTNLHKSNCLLNTEFDNIYIINTAFRNRIVSYRLNPNADSDYCSPDSLLKYYQKDLIKLITMSLNKLNCIKLNFEFFAYYILPHSDKQELKSFNTKYEIVYKSTDLHELLFDLCDTLKRKLSEFEHCQSGWTYLNMSHLEINVNKYSPLQGGMYLPLPARIRNSKSCINIKNEDNHCFLWSIVAALFPAKNNVCKTSSYPHFSRVLNTEKMTFPPSPSDIKQFEANNPNISINIYGLDRKSNVTGPLYVSKSKATNHINLLYIEKGEKAHYCLITDLLRLVRRQVSHYKGNMYLCENCLQFFSCKTKYRSHDCASISLTLPEKNSTIKFKHYERQQKIHFIIYADFECILLDHSEHSSENTKILKKHRPSCFAYYICCSYDDSLHKYVSYRGDDCVEVFVKRIIKDAKRLHTILTQNKTMTPLTAEQETAYQNATSCYICNQPLFGDKVHDHDHVTTLFRGAAHSHCNLMHRVCPFIPVVFHNLSGYDSHLFIEELVKHEGSIKIIPKTKEKYLSITKYVKTSEHSSSVQIKFIDSYQFMSSSLDTLSKSLSENDFVNLSREFPDKNQRDLLLTKGVYPYEYMDDSLKFNENELPSKASFYNSLKEEHITDIDYDHAKKIWKVFNIKSLGEYTDLYLKGDVLLLCDIFEKFRNTSMQYYKLDPAYYITSPSLSWDAMLFYTKIELDLITDLEMYQMIEQGIRGGLSQCSLRHAKANNKYLPNFNESEPSSYLIYLDCNNLYGYAMMHRFPISEFRFLCENEKSIFDVMSIPDDNNYGYILEVDLAYPDYLHDKHKDLPFAVEKIKPPGGKTSKLIASLYHKFNYVIHYTHLKECLKNGLVLLKTHRILSFRQMDYLKKYIELNTSLRQASKTAFEKDFFKLLINSIYGKTLQNSRNLENVKLVTKWNDTQNKTNKSLTAAKLITKPNFKSVTIFSENFVAIQLNQEKIVLDKPIYTGFTVLEYAKEHLYRFHYDFIRNMFRNKAHLCYTDTDSLLYLIYTDDFYKDMYQNISKFDTSNFSMNNPYNIPQVNEKIPGLFKDEMGGDVIKEFVGLRAKLYCINSVKASIKKAKGVCKPVTNRLTLNDYKEELKRNKQIKCKMNLIRSIKHVIYSQQVDKKVMNRNDDKRQVFSDQIHTLPWGHCDTIF